MAREAKLSQTAISRIWRAFGLQPHRQETFKLSTDPLFVEKTRDIVGLYIDPPVKALEDATRNYLKLNNADPKPFAWTKSANDIMVSIERFCLRISNS